MKGRPRRAVPSLLLALIFAAGPAIAQPADSVSVVASFSILGDLVHEVGGGRVDVVTLVGPGGDAHVYSPTPADAKKLAAAKLAVVNGLGFEGWMERLVKASATEARIVVASTGVTPRRTSGLAHGAGGIDPHAWQAVGNVEIYVGNIRDALVGIDPARRAAYEEGAAAYLQRLSTLDGDVRRAIATIPPERRKVITTHDAFGYFGAAYGVEFLALEGVSPRPKPQRGTSRASSRSSASSTCRPFFSRTSPTPGSSNGSPPRPVRASVACSIPMPSLDRPVRPPPILI